ncbi:hypothetical protein HO173_003804 [Letharia columbiana]|uniref:Pentatricopeptide repeat-containing protein n=1 Tax=Letharia columbiana TaxID=112416 RepID=A0A8H6L7A6_9LECA|nr:uncharacterized protein HO173_003804 [Letharia columbiana]KAF6238170.1 hypothetical protein HO173_003804 [Letharia columbiana]
MATLNASVERNSSSRVKPVKRPLGPQLLTFVFTFLQPATFLLLSTLKEQPIKTATRKHRPTPSTPPPPPRQLDNIFIDALAKACLCRQHTMAQAIVSNPGYLYHKVRRRNAYDAARQLRHVHRAAISPCPPAKPRPLSRDEYLSMLDYYSESYSTRAGVLAELPPATPMSFTFKSENTMIPPPEVHTDIEEPPPPAREQATDKTLPSLVHLLEVLDRGDCTHEEAFEAYSALPFPGVSYLSDHTRRLLFYRLSVLEKKNKTSKVRFLSVVEDMKSTNLPMTRGEWTSAIAFCGQCFTRITAVDVENALRMWKEMEQEANVKGGSVTFNILFDMAAKAEKFVLAEMILKEMGVRKLEYNRYSRNAFIFYHGLRGDGDAVRRAYREYVEAGEIVDTVVMNCVITSLIRAGEPAAAEQVFERMKRMHTKHSSQHIPPSNWRDNRDLGRLLNRATQRFREEPWKIRQLQKEQSIAPDVQTYAHFVEYHVSQTGELRRIAALLAEMQHQGLPMHGRIFTKLFKGFTYHGGVRYTSWTRARLEIVWESMLGALDQGLDDVRMMKWMVIWAVKAFKRCAGRQRTLEIWSELRQRGKPSDGDMEFVMGLLGEILPMDGGYYR